MSKAPTICPKCGSPIKYVKAGVSKKTGKPYAEFWACSKYECDYTWRPEKRGTKQTPLKEYDQGEQILKGLREVYAKIDSLEGEFKDFVRIFAEKQE